MMLIIFGLLLSLSLRFIAYIVITPLLAALTVAIYRLFLHPLSSVPGPRLATLSNAWLARQICQGRLLRLGKTIHERYGPIVRVGPNEVWISSEQGFKAVYGAAGSGLEKADFYLATALEKPSLDWRLRPRFPDTLDLLSERDMRRYRLQRRLIGHTYHPSNLRRHRRTLDDVLDRAVAQLRSLDGAEVDLQEWMHIIAVESLGAVVLSWSPGYLRSRSDWGSGAFSYLGWKRKTIFGLFPWAVVAETLSKGAGRVFADLWGVSFKAPKTLKHFFPAVHRKIKARLTMHLGPMPPSDSHKDLLADLIKLHQNRPEFTATYLHRMAITNFGAGHETTASALTSVMALLGTHPDVQSRVLAELSQEGKDESEGASRSLHALPLTLAAIKEAQRLYPAIGIALPRKVPVGGLWVHGHHLPARTTLGCNPTSLHRNRDIFGQNANEYDPDRWLSPDRDTRTAMERCNLTWGGGARTCPGRHLAEMILHEVVERLIREFNVVAVMPPDDAITYYFMAILTGVKVRFRPRSRAGSEPGPGDRETKAG